MEERYIPRDSMYKRLKERVFLFRSPWIDILQYVLLVFLIFWFLAVGTSNLGYKWDWYRIPQYIFANVDGHLVAGPLIQGLLFTFQISGVSLVFAMVIGLGTALGRLSDRNTPLVVQMYLVYFVIGPIIGLDRFPSAVLALSLFEGSYMSEIFRAGIVSLHKGQWEASHALGLSTFDTYRDVILPQAIRRISPPLAGEVISLIKNSSLVSLVSLTDLTMEARIVSADTFLTFEIWFTTAAIYLVVTITLSLIVNRMEKKFRILT
jgi:polar amino acid transport system permease protein